MTAEALAALRLSAAPAPPSDPLAQYNEAHHFVGQSPAAAVNAFQIDEPSSLALAIVGVAMLTAYGAVFNRTVFKRSATPSTTKSTAKRTAPPTRAKNKPRRRAA